MERSQRDIDRFEPALALARTLDPGIVERRRANYRILLDILSSAVPAPFVSLPDGACPFAFPIQMKEAAWVVASLERRGVKALLLWKNPHPSLPAHDVP